MRKRTKQAGLLGVAAGVFLAGGPLAVAHMGSEGAQSGLEIGEAPAFTFRAPLTNGMGVANLEDLRGKPVLVEFWGTR